MAMQGIGNSLRYFEVTVGNPHRQDILALVFLPFDTVTGSAVNVLIEQGIGLPSIGGAAWGSPLHDGKQYYCHKQLQ